MSFPGLYGESVLLGTPVDDGKLRSKEFLKNNVEHVRTGRNDVEVRVHGFDTSSSSSNQVPLVVNIITSDRPSVKSVAMMLGMMVFVFLLANFTNHHLTLLIDP